MTELQRITDQAIKTIEDQAIIKEKEIMQV
jgi:ribosome recycling factor